MSMGMGTGTGMGRGSVWVVGTTGVTFSKVSFLAVDGRVLKG